MPPTSWTPPPKPCPVLDTEMQRWTRPQPCPVDTEMQRYIKAHASVVLQKKLLSKVMPSQGVAKEKSYTSTGSNLVPGYLRRLHSLDWLALPFSHPYCNPCEPTICLWPHISGHSNALYPNPEWEKCTRFFFFKTHSPGWETKSPFHSHQVPSMEQTISN